MRVKDVTVLVLVVLISLFLSLKYFSEFKVKSYPKISSKYDYETFHMQHAKNIIERKPDCYVDTRGWFYSRPYWCLEALLTFYDNRKDGEWLDLAVNNLEKVYSRASDSDNDGFLDFKSYYDYDGVLLTHGAFAKVFADAAHIIRKNKVEKFYPNAEKYEKLVDEHLIPYGLPLWVSYDVEGGEYGYFRAGFDRTDAVAYNRAADFASAILRRGIDTNDEKLIGIAQRYANRFFKVNEKKEFNGTAYITAKHYAFDPDSGESFNSRQYSGNTDLQHLNLEFDFLLSAYENGLIKDEDFRLITNALKVMMMDAKVGERVTPVIYWTMNPPRKVWADEDRNVFEQSGHVHNFVRLGILDPSLVYGFEEILRNLELDGQLQGNYYSQFYKCVKDPRLDYKEFCSSSKPSEYTVEDMSLLLGIANLGRFQ